MRCLTGIAQLLLVASVVAVAFVPDTGAQEIPYVTGGISWGYHTETEHAALVWTPTNLYKVPDFHNTFIPYAEEVTEGLGGPSIHGVQGVAWEPWTDWTTVPSALIWSHNIVLRNANDSYSATEVTIDPGGGSISDVRGILWEDWYDGYTVAPVALIWTGTKLYSYYSSSGVAREVTVDPGGASVSDIQGAVFEHWETAGGKPVALIWTPDNIYYFNSNLSLTTVSEVRDQGVHGAVPIDGVQGVVWENRLDPGGRSTALIWTNTELWYYNANLSLTDAEEVLEDGTSSIDSIQGIAWQEIDDPGTAAWALIWTPTQVFRYNEFIDIDSATEITMPFGPPFTSIKGVKGVAWQHWQGYEAVTEALIWTSEKLLGYMAGDDWVSEIREDGHIQSLSGVLGVAWEPIAYAAGLPSALIWTSDKVLTHPVGGGATEVQIGGAIADVQGIAWEYWLGENSPVALIWTPDKVFHHTTPAIGDGEVLEHLVEDPISCVQGIVWEPFEERWDPFTYPHTALIWTPSRLFWYNYLAGTASEVKDDGVSLYSYDPDSVAVVQVAVHQAGHHDFSVERDGLRTSQSGAGLVGRPPYTPVGYTGSASGAALVPSMSTYLSHTTVLGAAPYANTSMILGPMRSAGFVSGDAMCLFGFTDITSIHGDRGSPGEGVWDVGGNYPNPFNPATVISYTLPSAAHVDLRIYDVSGRLVRVLRDNALEDPGHHEAQWDGRDRFGREVSSGVYYYCLTAGAHVETNQMIVVR
jgi:hypothetical protein